MKQIIKDIAYKEDCSLTEAEAIYKTSKVYIENEKDTGS